MGPHDERESRPADNQAAVISTEIEEDESILAETAAKAADNALRVAWLRVHAEELLAVDTSGQLSAHLLDFADLLEVAQREGWFG